MLTDFEESHPLAGLLDSVSDSLESIGSALAGIEESTERSLAARTLVGLYVIHGQARNIVAGEIIATHGDTAIVRPFNESRSEHGARVFDDVSDAEELATVPLRGSAREHQEDLDGCSVHDLSERWHLGFFLTADACATAANEAQA